MKKKIKFLTFKNNKGKKIALPDNMTLGDFAKLGVKLKLLPADQPIPDDWYCHTP